MKTASTYLYQVMSEIVLLHGGRAPKPYDLTREMALTWESEPNGVVVKLHEYHEALDGINYRALVTVRDPRDVFMSIMHFQENDFKGAFASRAVQHWSDSLRSWEGEGKPSPNHIMYEELLADPSRGVKSIAQAMGFNIHSAMADYLARKWGREANKIRAEMKLDQNNRHFMSARHIYSGELKQWQELSPRQLAQVEEHFKNEITRFKYD